VYIFPSAKLAQTFKNRFIIAYEERNFSTGFANRLSE
jgi:hypothetical protein